MENDLNINDKLISMAENKFEIEFLGQNLNKNESFIQWQTEMKKIYGNDAKLFKCKEDKILYYGKFSDCKKIPIFKIKCPICKRSNCYFCSKHIDDYLDNGKCCLSRRIYCLFFQEAFEFINDPHRDDFIHLIPFLSLVLFIGFISACFFYYLKVSRLEPNNIGNLENYEERIRYNNFFRFLVIIGINVAFAVSLSIPFFIYDLYFKTFLCIISIFSNYYPLKYYFNLVDHMIL